VLGIDSCEMDTPGGREARQETLPLQGGSVILRTEPGADTDRDGRLLRYVQAVIGGGQIGDCGLYRYDHTGVYQGGDDASGEYVQQLYGADLTFAASPPSGRECGQDPPSAYVPAPDPDVYVDTDDDDDHHDGGESRSCRDYWSGKQRAKYLGLSTLVAALSATLFIVVGGLWASRAGGRRSGCTWRRCCSSSRWRSCCGSRPAPPRTPPERVWSRCPLPDRAVPRRPVGGVVFYVLVVELPFVLDEIGLQSTAAVGDISAIMSLATAVGAGLFARLSGLSARVLGSSAARRSGWGSSSRPPRCRWRRSER
jgi:hypothetical protein